MSTPQELPRRSILLIEDTRTVAEPLREQLEGAGFEVHYARHGSEALAHLQKMRPWLVLLDVILPVMDGFKVLEAIKDQTHLAGMPVVLMSAGAAPAEAQRDPRVTAYLTKPFAFETLLALLRRQEGP